MVPKSVCWVDHRLIRDGHLERLQPREILLYFFLVLVGDREGLSYYGVRSISRYLKLPPQEIERARTSLCDRSLIAYREPLYQVLSLPEKVEPPSPSFSARRDTEPVRIGAIIKRVLKEDLHA